MSRSLYRLRLWLPRKQHLYVVHVPATTHCPVLERRVHHPHLHLLFYRILDILHQMQNVFMQYVHPMVPQD